MDVDALVDSIEDGVVIPIIGSGVSTIDQDGTLFDTWLAQKLQTKLDKFHGSPDESAADLDQNELSVNDVVTRSLSKGGDVGNISKQLDSILRRVAFDPPEPLIQLAEIKQFPLFLTTCFDPLLENALNQVRYGGLESVKTIKFSPTADQAALDLPPPKDEMSDDIETVLYYLFGKFARDGNLFAKWDEDAIYFSLALHNFLSGSNSLRLTTALRESDLLLIGVNFNDWLTRFFLAIVRQARLSSSDLTFTHTIADASVDDSLVVFFESAKKRATMVVEHDPVSFVKELHERCVERFGPSEFSFSKPFEGFSPSPKAMPSGSVFLSYSRDDFVAASRVKTELEAVGCHVWLDTERLQGGENWKNTLKLEIQQCCSVFVSLISVNSDNPRYCQTERIWANEVAMKFGQRPGDFYVPLFIDDVKTHYEPLPDHASINRVRYPGGATDEKFCLRIRELQRNNKEVLKL